VTYERPETEEKAYIPRGKHGQEDYEIDELHDEWCCKIFLKKVVVVGVCLLER
jgi:hypothetical protein